MASYFVVKSGMEVFDLTRAYGLATVLDILGGREIIVKDFEYYFKITCSDSANLDNASNLSAIVVDELNWRSVIRTGNVRDSQQIVKEWINNKKNIEITLKKFREIRPFDEKDRRTSIVITKRKKSGEEVEKKITEQTLLQSMDPRATKGFREEKLGRKYDEGKNVKVPLEDWVLCLVGHLNSTVFFEGERKRGISTKLVALLPIPSAEGTLIDAVRRDIKTYLEENLRWHVGGTVPTVTYSAISLRKFILQNIYRPSIRKSRISSLLFYCMGRPPRPQAQWKPEEVGKFDLEHVKNYSVKTLELWEDLLRKINTVDFRGLGDFKDVAIYLSEFISNANNENLFRCLASHLGMVLRCKSKERLAPFTPWLFSEESVKEVLKNVRTM